MSGWSSADPADDAGDELFDVAAVEAGAWAPGPYGADDRVGSFNEVTPERTARALRLLDLDRPVVTYHLGEELVDDFPAFRTRPPRRREQVLVASGYEPGEGFDGILRSPRPSGPNRASAHEERFGADGTYQYATHVDGLNHMGVGATFYNGLQGPDIARRGGTTELGNETMPAIVTRGVLLDVIGLVQAQGRSADRFIAADGAPVLRDDYRITLDDLAAAAARAGVSPIEPGDAVLIRTGWRHLARSDPQRYLSGEPGIYLREARWLASRRPALVGADTWGLEVLDPAVTGGNVFPVHQLLLVGHGIRIGEAIVTDALAEDGVFEFVFVLTPHRAPGATATDAPPIALGQRPAAVEA